MPRILTGRKARFTAALALTGQTLTQWAFDHGVHRVHLNAVLRGERESPRLIREADRFVANVERRFLEKRPKVA
jgi:hypothetical protein